MTRFIKHVGKNHLGSKVIIAFRELPDDANSCLVIETRALPEMYHDNLMRVVESNAAQATVDLYEVLGRSHFGDGQQMLNALHQRGLLKKHSVDQIVVEPMPNRTTSLRSVNDAIREGKGLPATAATPATPAKVDSPVLVESDPRMAAANKKPELSVDQKKVVAESKLLQARLMEDDAQKLRKEAYELDPELKKGGRPSKKQLEQLEGATEANGGENVAE